MRKLKIVIAGITKVGIENQVLHKDEKFMDDDKPFKEYGFNSSTAKDQAPAVVQLAFRDPDFGEFDTVEVTPLSSRQEPPDAVKTVSWI